jgi:hypothetical protein
VIEELNVHIDHSMGTDTAEKIVVRGVSTTGGGKAVVKRINTFLNEGN